MNYDQIVKYIEDSMNYGCVPGLSRIEKLLKLVGDPHKSLRVVHVAGTNGKGSTAAMIANILKASGYKTGVYISPHLYSIRERMTINGEWISEDDFVSAASKILDKISFMKDSGMEEPTQFEMLTAMAFLYFAEKNVDFLVLEVGLGGRYDATNIADSILSVITSISYDHTDILGDTIDKIAGEKGGIIKPDTVAVLYPQLYKEAEDRIYKICLGKNTKLVKVKPDWSISKAYNINGQVFDYCREGSGGSLILRDIELSLIGDHQVINASTALTAAMELSKLGFNITEASIREGLRTVKWPCRLSIVCNEPLVFIDGAHNEDGIDSLCKAINKYFSDRKIILLIGMLKDKNYSYAVSKLAPLANSVIATKPSSPRALSADELGLEFNKHNINAICIDDIDKAIKYALEKCISDSILCICGSLYLAGEAYNKLRNW